jgi:hypothetical protein
VLCTHIATKLKGLPFLWLKESIHILAMVNLNLCIFLAGLWVADAFAPTFCPRRMASISSPPMLNDLVVLHAISDGKKKKRRRKQPPTVGDGRTAQERQEEVEEEEVDLETIADVANFVFVPDDDITKGEFCLLVLAGIYVKQIILIHSCKMLAFKRYSR